ncbi:hypothetical protein [Embleya scabrispora]|uniref:hypothetical protein n=1 Tax=Embleya scabrispora TaxID=159449 RepID=UPI00099C111F|nr:hypothetical protein [Embleya scabrispora]
MPGDVGQCLRADPVRGQLHAGRQRGRFAEHGRCDPQTRLGAAVEQRGRIGQPRRGSRSPGPSARNTPSRPRISRIVSPLIRRIAANASRASSGRMRKGTLQQAFQALSNTTGADAAGRPSTVTAAVVCLVWVGVAVAVAAWVIERRDG